MLSQRIKLKAPGDNGAFPASPPPERAVGYTVTGQLPLDKEPVKSTLGAYLLSTEQQLATAFDDCHEEVSSSVGSVYSCASWSTGGNMQGQASPQTPEFGIPPAAAIASPHEMQFDEPDRNSYVVPHESISGRAGPFKLCTQDKYREPHLIHLPIILPDGVPPQENTLLPETPSPTEPSPVTEIWDGLDRRPSSCDRDRARRFAGDFGCVVLPSTPETSCHSIPGEKDVPKATMDKRPPLPTSPMTFPFPLTPDAADVPLDVQTFQDAGVVRDFMKEWNERTGEWRGRRRRDEEDSSLRNAGVALPDLVFAGDSTSDEFSWTAEDIDSGDECGMTGCIRCSALFKEVSLMVGITDSHGSLPSPGDSPPGIDCSLIARSSSTPPKGLSTVPTRRPINLPMGVVRRPLDLSPQSVTYTNLASRPVDNPRVTVGCTERLANPAKNCQNLRGLPEAQPITRQKCTGAIEHNSRRHPFLTDERMAPCAINSAMDANPYSPVPRSSLPPVECRSALDKLDTSLSKLKMHGPQQPAATGLLESTDREKKWPSLPTVTFPLGPVSNQGAGQQVSANDLRRLRAVPGPPQSPRSRPYGIIETLPTVASPRQRQPLCRPPSCAEEPTTVRSFMDMDAPAQKQRPRSTSLRSLMNNNGTMKKFARATAGLSQRFVAWGKNIFDH